MKKKGRLLSPILKVFLTDCPIGERKNEKKFAITKIVLIFVVLFGLRAVLHCFGCPFQNEK